MKRERQFRLGFFVSVCHVKLVFAGTVGAAPGELDTTFGGTGKTQIRFEFGDDFGNAVVVQPDGKVLVAGFSTVGYFLGGAQLALVRYDTNNVLDRSFGDDGKVLTSISSDTNATASAAAIAVQKDGKIVVGGSSIVLGHPRFVGVRYTANGALDGSYGVSGRAFVSFNDEEDNNAYALAVDSLGRVLIAGDAGRKFGVARLQGSNLLRILSISRLENGRVTLRGVGVPSQRCAVWISTNLSVGSFSVLGETTADGLGFWQYEDGSAANGATRFYRLSSP